LGDTGRHMHFARGALLRVSVRDCSGYFFVPGSGQKSLSGKPAPAWLCQAGERPKITARRK
jgi:hypothetical protein